MKKVILNESVIFDHTFYDVTCGKIINPVLAGDFSIIQAVDSQYFSKCDIPSHAQNCDLELTVVAYGVLENENGEQKLKLSKNEAAFSFFGERHALRSKKTCRFLTLAFNISPSSPFFEKLQTLKTAYRDKKYIADSNFTETVQAAIREFISYDEYSPLVLAALLSKLLVSALRSLEKKEKTAQSLSHPLRHSMDEEDVLAAVLTFIDERFADICTLQELTKLTSYSYSTVFRRFKEVYGCSPMDYLTYKKIDSACDELKKGASVEAIGEKLGYSSPYNFSRAFKRQTGFSPVGWKKHPVRPKNPLFKKS